MSVTKETTIWCDYPDCGNFQQDPWLARQIRRRLREKGWKRRNGKDYCPEHADASETVADRSDP